MLWPSNIAVSAFMKKLGATDLIVVSLGVAAWLSSEPLAAQSVSAS